MQIHAARHIAVPLIWNAFLAYVLLVTLPTVFEANISTIILFQPDIGWVTLVSGVFALVWGVINTGIGFLMLLQNDYHL